MLTPSYEKTPFYKAYLKLGMLFLFLTTYTIILNESNPFKKFSQPNSNAILSQAEYDETFDTYFSKQSKDKTKR